MKHKLMFTLKFTGLFAFYLIITMLSEALYPSAVEVEPSPGAIGALLTQLLINCLAIAYLTNRLELSGWKRIAATTLVVYGIQLFMTQMETWIFREAFPTMGQSELLRIFIMGFVVIFTASTFATLLWKKKTATIYKAENHSMLHGWGYKIPILSVVYMSLYFFFGTYIAFQSETLREFYETSVNNIDPNGLIIIQIFRGALWVLFCLPLVLWLKGSRTEKVIATALFMGLLPTILLFFPNPFMPFEIRMYHFVEVSISNGIFGALVAWWLTSKRNFFRKKSINLNPSGVA